MEWITRLNEAMEYIEEHLTENIDYADLGRIACCSAYHFQRMFGYMANVSLSEYIRRRRMTLAASDLQSGEKIIDVALKYGYSSPTSFNRAFQSIHAIAPSMAKENGMPLKSFSPISFKITIKGAEEMDYRIEKKEAFRIVGISQPLARETETNFKNVPQMWGTAQADGTLEALAGMMNSQPMGMLGVAACIAEEDWRYYIAAASTADAGRFEEYTIPAATWAIFTGSGDAQTIQQLEQQIFTEWLPNSGYEYGNAPDIEVYINPDPRDTRYEVWISVVKK